MDLSQKAAGNIIFSRRKRISTMRETIKKLSFTYGITLLFSGNLFSQDTTCIELIGTLLKRDLAQITPEEKKDLTNCIYTVQNRGFFYNDECKYDSSKYEIEKALRLWKHFNDTLNQANLLKYLGNLNGRLGKYNLAKNQIQEAIKLFDTKNSDFGIAVSLFNLSKVYEYENKIDSAIFFTKKSLDFWKTKKDTSRLMILYTNLIHLGTGLNSQKDITPAINENNSFLSRSKVYWLQELDFYFVTSEFFKSVNEKDNESIYKKLYYDKIESIEKRNGKKRYSAYDARSCR